MDNLDNVYNELIMEHSMNSRNKKQLACPTCSMMGHNPNCGDEIRLDVIVQNGIVADLAFSGHGCAISQSSTSIMIDCLKGKTVAQAQKIVGIFIKMIQRETLSAEEKNALGNAIIFENISNMPSRVKCVLLSWHTMEGLLRM